jgi:Kinesin motor domain
VLSNVITALTKENASNNKRFLHFRDSKLTFYLRDVLGGNSRTTIITNILNEDNYMFETLNTLKFSATAKTIKISPKANYIAEGTEEELQAEISFLMRKVQKLEKENTKIPKKNI